jgi:MoaA/NifB/PqqE/SkfB family radical SAM enzyme
MSRIYSWTRLFTRTTAAALGREGRPTKLMFVVTKRCHSRCVYCDIWKAKDVPGALDAELSLDEIQSLASANPFFQWIDFTGGEPTDRPDFVEVVQTFDAHCPDLLLVHFPTNGLATDRIVRMARQLNERVRARLVVTVSIDGPPEINDRLRGVPRDFAHAVATFGALREILGSENVFVGMTLHGHLGSCGISTVALVERTHAAVDAALRDRGRPGLAWSNLHLNIPHVSQHYYANTAAENAGGFGGPDHRREASEALLLAAGRTGQDGPVAMRILEHIYRVEAEHYLATGRTRIGCAALLSTVYLSEKGEVYPCTIWDRPLGNVRKSAYALMPLIEKARVAGVRKAISKGKCPRCWTPCEAYPAIGASPLASMRALLEPAASKTCPSIV